MKETEITVQIFDNFSSTDKKLKSQGFEMIENYHMCDWYFSKFKDIFEFSYAELMKNSFLVRFIDGKAKICYKSKILDENGNVIEEEKVQTFVDDLDKALDIFKCANLNNYCVVDNESYVYKKGDIEFVIQIIKDLGIFLEYEENATMKNMGAKEKFNYMTNVVKELKLNTGEDFSCKKVFMLLHK